MPIDLSVLRLPQQQPAPSFMESQLRANQLMASQAQMAQNAMQLQKLASEREQENALTAAYQTPGVVGPDGRINYNALTTALQGGKAASQIPKVSELRFNAEKSAAELEKTQAQTKQERVKNINSKLGMFGEMQFRANTLEELLGIHNAIHADEDLGSFLKSLNVDPEKGRQEILSLDTPEKLQAFKSKSQLALKDVRQRFDDAEAIQSAEEQAAEALSQGAPAQVGPASSGRAPAVVVTADPRKQAILTADILASRGYQDLAKNYLEQATKAAQLPNAGVPEHLQVLRGLMADPKMMAAELRLRQSVAPNQTVNVGGKVYQQETAKDTMEIIRNAPKALQALEKTNTVMDLLEKGKANTGFAAQFRTDIDRAKALFSKRAPESVTDTELLQSLLGSDVFPLIRSLGIGAQGINTVPERDFLLKVMTGTINLDNATLKEMTRLRAKAYEQAIDEYNNRLKEGEFDDYMSETKRKLKPIEKPTRGKGTAAGGGVDASNPLLAK